MYLTSVLTAKMDLSFLITFGCVLITYGLAGVEIIPSIIQLCQHQMTEGDTDITCQRGERINVREAVVGEDAKCAGAGTTACHAVGSKEEIDKICHGKQQCLISAVLTSLATSIFRTCVLPENYMYMVKYTCDSDGRWNTWSLWDVCTQPCGYEERSRYRTCVGQKNLGLTCNGTSTETTMCTRNPVCLIDGNFSSWTDWSDCSAACGEGVTTRHRTCVVGRGADANCTGDSEEEKACKVKACPTNTDDDKKGMYIISPTTEKNTGGLFIDKVLAKGVTKTSCAIRCRLNKPECLKAAWLPGNNGKHLLGKCFSISHSAGGEILYNKDRLVLLESV